MPVDINVVAKILLLAIFALFIGVAHDMIQNFFSWMEKRTTNAIAGICIMMAIVYVVWELLYPYILSLLKPFFP